MMYDQVAGFIYFLSNDSEYDMRKWKPLNRYFRQSNTFAYLDDYINERRNNPFDQISYNSSFYFTAKNGIVVLLHRLLKDEKTLMESDEYTLFIQEDDLHTPHFFDNFQDELRRLQYAIQLSLCGDFQDPGDFYNFLSVALKEMRKHEQPPEVTPNHD